MENFDILESLLKRDRSYRRFDESREIPRETLEKIVGLVRWCASGRNLQPLRYHLVAERDVAAEICRHMKWAGYLTDWDGPEAGERPAAMIVQCLDTTLTQDPMCDEGLQLQTLTLGATSLGLGCCIIKSFNAAAIRELLSMPESLKISYILAVGYPAEMVVTEEMEAGDIKYWRTPDGVHHVPKRGLKELIIGG